PARSIYAWFIMGAVVLAVLSIIPLLGGVVLIVGSLVGLGGWFVEPSSREPSEVEGSAVAG
ncbi:MAG: hypothetical protein KJO18_00840, partial [Acidimicrobiia bacterium]|nr:hypothetical protein [Acidimicrobiia bacterium]